MTKPAFQLCIVCGSKQVRPVDVKPGEVQMKCKKCSETFWIDVDLSDTQDAKPKKPSKPAKKKPKKAPKPKKTSGKWSLPENYDGSTPLPKAQWEAFAQAIFEQGTNNEKRNLTDAYYAAGYKSKTRKMAGDNASRLLGENNGINTRVGWMMQQIASKKIVDREEALDILSQHARADLSDYVTKDIDGTLFIKFDKDMPNSKAVKKIKTRTVFDENGNEIQAIQLNELDLHDPIKALERISKMQGWDKPDQLEHSIKGLEEVFKEIDEKGLRLPSEEEE